jgi:HD-GYP domain-containing protein (c-di-GMP phosphodiesterase class II)
MTKDVEEQNTKSYSGLLPGEKLLSDVYSLVQTTKIYQENNQLVLDGVENFRDSISKLAADADALELRVENGRFYIQDEKLVLRKEADHVNRNLLRYLNDRDLAGLKLASAAAAMPTAELVCFAKLLNEAVGHDSPAEWLASQFEDAKMPWVTPLKSGDKHEDGNDGGSQEVEVPGKRSPRKVYAYTMRAVQDVVKKLSSNQRVGTRKTVRMVQTMVEEVVLQEQPMMLTMSTIKAYDDYTFAHSVNVAILAMYIGKGLGLPKEILERLGICGLFHDLGKIVWPHELLNKVGSLSEDEFKQIRQHSLNSTRLIVQQMAVSVHRKGRMLLPPFEHHLKYDLTGYPEIGWKRPLSLCGRILAIADVYDALTSPRVYRKEAMSADRALGLMLQGSGTVFDPIILKVFINMLGVYPIGTLLELDGGELALVSRRPTSDDITRPWVVLLQSDGNSGYLKGEEIDLADKDSAGRYRREIIASMNPTTYNIQPAEILT